MIKTIRGQILLAFLAMSMVTAALGLLAAHTLHSEVKLIDRTYDQSLMSINYARAAAADFNGLQAAFARRLSTKDPMAQAALDQTTAMLQTTIEEDLSIAAERAQSDRAVAAAGRVLESVKAWSKAQSRFIDGVEPSDQWHRLDELAAIVGEQIDLLVNYTAGDGFTYLQIAHKTVQNDLRIDLCATAFALVFSGLIAWFLARRIIVAMKKASDVAKRIAAGDLDVTVPIDHGDELGALMVAMEVMRGNIKTSLDREVGLRHSAQARLGDALESSSDGIVLIDAEGTVVLANPQALLFLSPIVGALRVGDRADWFVKHLAAMPGAISNGATRSVTCEIEVPGGRLLRLSQNVTQDGGSIIFCSDISLVKAQQAALKASNLWLDSALANLSQGLCLFDADDRLQVFNHQFCDIFRVPTEKVMHGMTLSEIVDIGFTAGDTTTPKTIILARIKKRIERRQNVSKLLKMDDGRVVALSHRPLQDGSWLATYEDVTDRLEAQQKIAFMARHDALTDLPNRVLFAERVESALIATKGGQAFALLCLDLDHFKQVNDTLGHPFGDELLRVVATTLRNCIGESDMVARLGGDEFAIVQPIMGGAEEASVLAWRLQKALAAPFEVEGHRVSIGVSIGISLAPADGTSYGKLLKNADVALYKAKADGRGTWRFFESAMDEQLQARRLMELDLREALDKNQLEVHYQPLFDILANRICGVEALVRWFHPVRGLVSPAAFIPLAEEIGFVTRIGDFVLERACRDAMTWPKGISVAVNVSAAQFREEGLVRKVTEVLFDSGLAANRLDLEITEGVLLANDASTLVALNQLRELGVRIAMDDFGTGYSSLSYLRSFPFDKVKIDQSFTRDVCAKAESSAIVRTVISLCRSLGMRITAEGVETAEQLAFLRAECCHEAQGFYLSKPMPTEDLLPYFEIEHVEESSKTLRRA